MSDTLRTDEQEAIHRAEWLTQHGAPLDWVVLTTDEVAMLKAERDALKTALKTIANAPGADDAGGTTWQCALVARHALGKEQP